MKVSSVGNNQTELEINGKLILVSYKTPISAIIDGVGYKTTTKWSATSSRHQNQFLGKHGGFSRIEEKPQSWFDDLLK